MMQQNLLKFAQGAQGALSPAGGLLRRGPFTSWWIVEKRSSFSYLGQNQKNYKHSATVTFPV
jgi:hypothetical protein